MNAPDFADVVLLASFAAAFAIPLFLRVRRNKRTLWIVPLAASLVPATIAFATFVYPAASEYRVWWSIAAVTSALCALVAASLGYALAVVIRRRGAA